MRWLKRLFNEPQTEVNICEGVTISSSIYTTEEKRLLTMLLKGIIVYLLTMGSIGSYLSAVNSEYNSFALNVVIFLTAILCSLLYYNVWVENIGYIIFFSFFAGLMYLFRDYINSGFYSVVNDSLESAADFFDMRGFTQYNEKISDTQLAITIMAMFVGVFTNIVLNNYISRSMRYVTAGVIIITLNIFPFYLGLEPDTIYTVMMFTGLLMSFILKRGQHFRMYRDEKVFRKEKWGITYIKDFKSMVQLMIMSLIVILIYVGIMNIIVSKKNFSKNSQDLAYKKSTMDTVYNILTLGIGGVYNFYNNTGGLSSGRLGGVATVRLDYQTDIEAKFVPHGYDTMYLKNFTGYEYFPYSNRWEKREDYESPNEECVREAMNLKKEYDSLKKDENSQIKAAKGVVEVKNIEGPNLSYLPYYTLEGATPVLTGKTKKYEYYPRFEDTSTSPATSGAIVSASKYLKVPEENTEAINELISLTKADKNDTLDEKIKKIEDYYQEKIPYTISPGATKAGQDFVNYFIQVNKKGYCAHFASAATLYFRALNVPARYCEGYSISYNEVIDEGEISTKDNKYEDYYDGYNALGKTTVVRYEATDADAHAWVEVYDAEKGWIVADVTPSSDEDDDDNENFWSRFRRSLENRNRGNNSGGAGGLRLRINDEVMKTITIAVLILIFIMVFVFLISRILPIIRYHLLFRKSDMSDRLIMEYMKNMRKYEKKLPELKSQKNHNSQIDYLLKNEYISISREGAGKMKKILETAAFSKENIDKSDYEYAIGVLKRIKI